MHARTHCNIPIARSLGSHVAIPTQSHANSQEARDDEGNANGVLRVFTGNRKDDIDDGTIILTTYYMFAMDDSARNEAGRRIMKKLKEIEFGLIVLDEVHVAPAEHFRNVITQTKVRVCYIC